MDKTEREAVDFMNVESFSQLPEKPIRLFGKEFGGGGNATTTTDLSESIDSNPFHDKPEPNTANYAHKESHINEESNRKYECQYCFRNFPTSQALGGHQNAHKRERQNAKRAHLQSALAHEANIYGIMNHHRLGEPAAHSTTRHSTWNNINNSTRSYGNHVISPYSQTPINRNPLAFWRIPPPVQQNSSSNLGFPNDDLNPFPMVKSPNCDSRFGYEPNGGVQDHLSLDLHLEANTVADSLAKLAITLDNERQFLTEEELPETSRGPLRMDKLQLASFRFKRGKHSGWHYDPP